MGRRGLEMNALRALSREIADLVEEVKDSVVTIVAEIPTLDFFFELQQLRSVGSGFAVSRNYVITNAHVVREAEEVRMILSSGDEVVGRVVARDATRDLALVLSSVPLRSAKLGDSDKVRVGEVVLAIGSPLGLVGPSVTLGVVSAVGRTIVDRHRGVIFEDLIQTDAAINPGNSGGPLINLDGEVVGVTTAMIPYAQGIGFAIPINTAKRFLWMLEKYGRPLRAWIGVYVAQLTPLMSRTLGLAVNEGVLVVSVVPNTPAYMAGIREGDIIVGVDGRSVKKPSELREAVELAIDKGYVTLKVVRGGYRFEVDVPVIVEEL